MAASNTRPRQAPVVVAHDLEGGGDFLRLIPAGLASAIFHVGLFALLFLILSNTTTAETQTEADKEDKSEVVKAEPQEKPPESNDPFSTTDLDPARQEFDTDIKYVGDRKEDVSVPGLVDVSYDSGLAAFNAAVGLGPVLLGEVANNLGSDAAKFVGNGPGVIH